MLKDVAIIDYISLTFYMLLMVAIGVYFKRFMRGAREYFIGGNLIPWWVSGISFYMASFSAWTFTGAAGFVYHTGFFAILYFLSWSISFLIGYRFTAARWRRSRVISPVEYSATRFNVATQQIVSWVQTISGVLGLGITLTAVSKVIAPTIHVPIEYVIVVTGIIMLLYTYLGGLWAVAITDVVQFVFLIAITLVVMPLSVHAIGGVKNLLANTPPLRFDYVYNNMQYDVHYLIAMWLINIIVSMSFGAAPRYYSVIDEKSAKRVGLTCGLLFLTVPVLFGVPPLVGRILWPDLLAVDFFKNIFQPNDAIYLGVCLLILPNGLIGIFLAAMFAATMSTIATSYNVTSAIIARDIYKARFKPAATDTELLIVGRIATFVIAVLTIILAVIYARSPLGIFNLMVVLSALFSMPILIPMAFGLLVKRLAHWAAVAAIVWGLGMGLVEKFLLGWTVGPQVYGATVVTGAILLLSWPLGRLFQKNRFVSGLLAAGWAIFLLYFFHATAVSPLTGFRETMVILSAAAFGLSLYLFSFLFSLESEEHREMVEAFFRKIKTPVDVNREVFGAGLKEISSFRLVGILTMSIGVLILLLLLSPPARSDWPVNLMLSGALLVFGFLMYHFGGRSEGRFAEERRRRAG